MIKFKYQACVCAKRDTTSADYDSDWLVAYEQQQVWVWRQVEINHTERIWSPSIVNNSINNWHKDNTALLKVDSKDAILTSDADSPSMIQLAISLLSPS